MVLYHTPRINIWCFEKPGILEWLHLILTVQVTDPGITWLAQLRFATIDSFSRKRQGAVPDVDDVGAWSGDPTAGSHEICRNSAASVKGLYLMSMV